MDLVKVLAEQQIKNDLPELKVGATVKVHQKIKEGNRERIQIFEGTIIAIKHTGINKSVTVRRISYGVGVEKTFPVHSRTLQSSRSFVTVRFAVLSCTTCAAESARQQRFRKSCKFQPVFRNHKGENSCVLSFFFEKLGKLGGFAGILPEITCHSGWNRYNIKIYVYPMKG